MPIEFELATCIFDCDTLSAWAICNTLYRTYDRLTEESGEVTDKFANAEGNVILKLRKLLNGVFTTSELECASISCSTFPCLRVRNNAKCLLNKKCVKHLFKVIVSFTIYLMLYILELNTEIVDGGELTFDKSFMQFNLKKTKLH